MQAHLEKYPSDDSAGGEYATSGPAMIPTYGGNGGKSVAILGQGLLRLEADRSFSRAILGDDGAHGHARTTALPTNNVSQRIREAVTLEQALTIMLEASRSEARLRSRVRAAATLEDALDEILAHDHGGNNDIDLVCPTVPTSAAASETIRDVKSALRINVLCPTSKVGMPYQGPVPPSRRARHTTTIRVAPSTKRPRLPEFEMSDTGHKHVRVNQPISNARNSFHSLNCLGEQGQGSRDGDRTRRSHPDCPPRELKPRNRASA